MRSVPVLTAVIIGAAAVIAGCGQQHPGSGVAAPSRGHAAHGRGFPLRPPLLNQSINGPIRYDITAIRECNRARCAVWLP